MWHEGLQSVQAPGHAALLGKGGRVMRAGFVALMAACVLVLGLPLSWGQSAPPSAAEPIVEVSERLPNPNPGMLGTMVYPPTEKEKPFLEKLPAGEAKMGGVGEKEPYSMTGKVGKPVGWFGIVREKSYDKKRDVTRLLLEMKYFDGLTDLHIQVVSINGAGDFAAELKGKAETIPMLSLVRIYGKVGKEEKEIPEVVPEYVRVWDWGLFTFMDYGTDKSNPKWVKLRKVTGDDVYKPYPNEKFYEDRLGPRPKP